MILDFNTDLQKKILRPYVSNSFSIPVILTIHKKELKKAALPKCLHTSN